MMKANKSKAAQAVVGNTDPASDSYSDEEAAPDASFHNSDDDQSTGTRFSGKSNSAEGTLSDQDKDVLARRETAAVFRLRLLVVAVLLLAAVAVCFVVYFVTVNSEHEQFETQFRGAATTVERTFLDIAQEKIGAAGALVVALVADGEDTKQRSWPFVTLSSFQRRANSVKDLSGALYIAVNPIVKREQREQWENYTMMDPEAIEYYKTTVVYQQNMGYSKYDNRPQVETDDDDLDLSSGVASKIYALSRFIGAKATVQRDKDQYLPEWQVSPISSRRTMINEDRSENSEGLRNCLRHDAVVFEGLQWSRPGYGNDEDAYTQEIAWLLNMHNKEATLYPGDLFSTVYLPIYSTFETDRDVVGTMRLIIYWANYFKGILPPQKQGVIFVLDDSCGEPFTYMIDGGTVHPLGLGDLHDPKYEHMMQTADFTNVDNINDGTEVGMKLFQDACPIRIRVYPSEKFEMAYRSSTPAVITFSVACVFLFAICMFFFYDRLVERRQKLVLRKAEQTTAIVASLFPKNVRDRMMEENSAAAAGTKKGGSTATQWKNGEINEEDTGGAPIADLFPECTVMFCDIAGFTAWSSSRDPTQVFTLLQHIYQAFDKIAKRRKVFKVETIGDSYVAVTGLPEPQERHALIAIRFANECMEVMRKTVRKLETTLGPDTGDLTMRFGLHSGPVTAGVLMGDRARFQLFGDTVNTASRMESTGMKDKIQVSSATAEILIASGKQHWVRQREDAVKAKGKGVMKTYWVTVSSQAGTSVASSDREADDPSMLASVSPSEFKKLDDKAERLANWMTELFKNYLKDIIATRKVNPPKGKKLGSALRQSKPYGTPLDEVVEVVELAQFDTKAAASLGQKKREDVELPAEVVSLLREFVCMIAEKYHANPFHNFEHACHVTLSVDKFLKKIVAPDIQSSGVKFGESVATTNVADIASQLHDYTHGINSDPIALFAIVFSALVHDVDHRGVSNVQLGKEEAAMLEKYNNKSIAEQNSLDVAWDILNAKKFDKLREYIFATSEELARFRQVLVNVVLATDIFDKELNDLRKNRWTKAFSEEELNKVEKNGLRATIVIEHIIQASDVSHTMQHWHIYTKWNKRLFMEMHKAFTEGRMGVDPATFWYKGEIGFFDNYIIPLAKKLKDCKVFGVNSDQCLVYAQKNREEWEERGQEILAGYLSECKSN